jgi:hypothetical protein
MKIPTKKSKQAAEAPWHQDFRNVDALPDIKVIRTRFFVNLIAVVVPLFIATLWVQQELSLSTVRSEIAELENEKKSLEASNTNLVGLSRNFVEEAAKIESLDDYYYNLFSVSDYLVSLSKRVSEDMVISTMELKKANRVEGSEVLDTWESQISGYVILEDQTAVSHVNQFLGELREEELIAEYLDDAFLDNLSRDQVTDTLNFVVSIVMSDTVLPEETKEDE